MTKSESQVVRQIMKQRIMYEKPLLVRQPSGVSIVGIASEQSIRYVATSSKQKSELKRKYERLVEAMTSKTKRVNQQDTGLGKRKKTLLTIV